MLADLQINGMDQRLIMNKSGVGAALQLWLMLCNEETKSPFQADLRQVLITSPRLNFIRWTGSR